MHIQKLRHTRAAKGALFDFLLSEDVLEFPEEGTPRVSIILVLYNRAELTLQCLQSLLSAMDASYEVVIVDNKSTDESELLLGRIRGARIIANEDNVGFLRACNQAAEVARGEYLLLLNNDATLDPGGIAGALDVFERRDDVGAVGAKIRLLSGRLQEAGSIIWSDGSCLGYGRDWSPDDPRVCFERDVDYCSGAFLLTPRATWNELGGFDDAFAPAYYEETDYCVRLQEQGLAVVYTPTVQITHFEFASSDGGDSAAMAQMAKNQTLFSSRHEAFLRDRLAPDLANVPRARSAKREGLRVLYIDDRVPRNHIGAGFPRSNDVVHALVEAGAQVTLLPYNFPFEGQDEGHAGDIPRSVELMHGSGRHNVREFMQERVDSFDAIWISRPHNMVHFVEQHIPWGEKRPALVYDAEAFFALRDIQKALIQGSPLDDREKQNLLQKEAALVSHADHVIAVSEAERLGIGECATEHVRSVTVIAHQVEANPTAAPFEERCDFLFIGNLDYCDAPNADSILWFVREVWPGLREQLPAAALHIVGSNECDAVRNLRAAGVTVHGRAADLTAFYNRARVFIAPTRYSAGIPYKVHDSAAAGVPAVASRLLAKQLGWGEEELAVAETNDAEDFLRQCIGLYGDEALWLSLRERALQRIHSECSREHFAAQVESVLREIKAREPT